MSTLIISKKGSSLLYTNTSISLSDSLIEFVLLQSIEINLFLIFNFSVLTRFGVKVFSFKFVVFTLFFIIVPLLFSIQYSNMKFPFMDRLLWINIFSLLL